MRRIFIVVMFSFVLAMPSAGFDTEAVVVADDCLPLDSKCLEEQAECDYWDPLCKDDLDECPSWKLSCNQSNSNTGLTTRTQTTNVEYTEEVSCSLVLKEPLGGISGYCDNPGRANLDHCVTEGSSLSDKYSVDFHCIDGIPPLMAKASRNEVRVTDLGGGFSFGAPFWIICDEGMGGFSTNKRCYDSDFSDSDDWKIGCEEDNRLMPVYESGDSYQWYVCS